MYKSPLRLNQFWLRVDTLMCAQQPMAERQTYLK